MKLFGFVSMVLSQVTLDYGTFTPLVEETTVSYLGIPFGLPPTGASRFKPPTNAWSKPLGDFNASHFGPACYQNSKTAVPQSEDCLNLNVFIPRSTNSSALLPVLVWVYGGSFTSGTNSEPGYDVSINYRLGALGFMDGLQLAKEGPLNAGLLDQKLAFEWVGRYIERFGGDPKRVTAAGESAGAISLGIHLVADNGNQKLFDRAILLSGGPPLFSLTVPGTESVFQGIAADVGCNNTTPLDCLRQVDAATLIQKATRFKFYPVVDQQYFGTESLDSFLNVKKFSQIPLLIHTNRDEGTVFGGFAAILTEKQAKKYRRSLVPFFSEEISLQIDALYPTSNYAFPFQAGGDFFSDVVFQCPASLLSSLEMQAGAPVYNVRNNHVNQVNSFSSLLTKPLGVYHGSELVHFFQETKRIGPKEIEFSQRLHDSYFRFAVGGAPLESWPTYGNKQQYLIEEQVVVTDTDRDVKCNLIVTQLMSYFKTDPAYLRQKQEETEPTQTISPASEPVRTSKAREIQTTLTIPFSSTQTDAPMPISGILSSSPRLSPSSIIQMMVAISI